MSLTCAASERRDLPRPIAARLGIYSAATSARARAPSASAPGGAVRRLDHGRHSPACRRARPRHRSPARPGAARRRRRSKASSTSLAISGTSFGTPIRQTRHASTKTRVEAHLPARQASGPRHREHRVAAWGNGLCPRGGLEPIAHPFALAAEFALGCPDGGRSCGRMLSRRRPGAPGQIELGDVGEQTADRYRGLVAGRRHDAVDVLVRVGQTCCKAASGRLIALSGSPACCLRTGLA